MKKQNQRNVIKSDLKWGKGSRLQIISVGETEKIIQNSKPHRTQTFGVEVGWRERELPRGAQEVGCPNCN